MTETTITDPHEGARIREVVREGVDRAYQTRVDVAVQRLMAHTGAPEYPALSGKLMGAAGLSHDRWVALHCSTRDVTAAEFQAFARVLGVSPRWLAIGAGWMLEAPIGWSMFGSHLNQDVQLEFSETLDPGDLMPLWERPRQAVAA